MSQPSTTAVLDAIIIGGCAAGLTAAQVLGRARRDVTLIDGQSPRNSPAAHMHGYLSRDGMPPADLARAGRGEALGYGVNIVDSNVTAATWRGEEAGFAVTLANGDELLSRTLLVSTGLQDILPEIPGVQERWGIDVLHCPYCHAYEVREEAIGVLGGNIRELSIHQAFLLRQWSSDVVFFPNGIELTAIERSRLTAHGVTIVDEPVRGLIIDRDHLRAVELDNGQLVPRAAVFVGPRFVPRDQMLTTLGCDIGPNGFVSTDPTGQTSIPGVWAAGNVVDPRAQVITAAGAGSAAAIALNGYLLADDVERSVARNDRTPETHDVFSAATELAISTALLDQRRAENPTTTTHYL
ncbi:NAD(P)/FAD-dependent oxidoreductase [Rhodococcus sp. OK302]|uniref:NAD(P)/FAD-dependent oxidoreductase n=1 Tax=Rhodococcus sp. OK302 TaxID=1882769 RepID=UPI000B93A9AF|nr:NAD(P)/FAD-dependent oxidoreductase [Rhodococcus sp. OK302]OYD61019.1 thioredoxin reductase [Rhodococcus sp. OK302]